MATFKIFRLSLFFLMAFFSQACSLERPVPPDTIRYHLPAEPATLNSIIAQDGYASEINSFIFDRLVDINPDTLKYKPKIAKRWEISEDKKTYVFYLREDVTWHDGHPLTADDVVFSYKSIMDPNVDSMVLKVYYKDIKEVRKIDDYTVQFIYADIYFKGFEVCALIDILPKHILEKVKNLDQAPFSRAPLGSGPYRFESWKTGKEIVLVRNENYWDKKPEIRRIQFKIVHDSTIALQVLKKGLLDYSSLRIIQWVKQTDTPKFRQMFSKLLYPGRIYDYIAWNQKNPIFKEKKVRQAMTMLVNRDMIRKKLMFGLGRIMTGPFFPYSKQYNSKIQPLLYDPETAKRLLEEVGWRDTDGDGILDKGGKKFEFEFLFSAGSKIADRYATILKEDLKKVGILMDISRLEWAAFMDRLNTRKFDAVSLAWSIPLEGDPYQVWHSSQVEVKGSSNFISFSNERADELMEAARVEFDPEKRNALYHEFQNILDDEQPYTFLFNTPNLVAVSKRFTNVKIHRLGLDLLEWKIMKKD